VRSKINNPMMHHKFFEKGEQVNFKSGEGKN
jgi:hypothetical protein